MLRLKESSLEKATRNCKMAATSLHHDALLDSEECHERTCHCAYADDDSLVGSPARARGCEMATQILC